MGTRRTGKAGTACAVVLLAGILRAGGVPAPVSSELRADAPRSGQATLGAAHHAPIDSFSEGGRRISVAALFDFGTSARRVPKLRAPDPEGPGARAQHANASRSRSVIRQRFEFARNLAFASSGTIATQSTALPPPLHA